MADDLLQRLGTAALANSAPAPLGRLVRGLGVQFVPRSGTIRAAYSGQLDPKAIASVRNGSPNTIGVENQQYFGIPGHAGQVASHEAVHLVQNNLPPSIAAKIPKDNPTDPYNYGGAISLLEGRRAGKTLLDLPREQQAALVQYYVSQTDPYKQKVAQGLATPDDHARFNWLNKVYGPWINDFNSMPQSVIEPTDPKSQGNTIVTTPRPVPGPATNIPGMQYAKEIYAPGQPAPGEGQPPDSDPPPPAGYSVDSSSDPAPPAGYTVDIPENSVTQTGAKTFQGPNVQMPYSFKSLAQGVGDLGKGAAKGVANTLFNAGANTPMPSYLSGSGFTDHANVGPKPDELNPQGTMQGLGYGAEQAGEFMLPASLENRLAGAATDAAPFLGKTLPKIGAQALSSGVVNAAQGGSFGGGALAGGIAGGLGSAARGMAGTTAESALGVRNVDRGFSKTPGQAILNDTRGVRPSTIADSARDKIDTLTGRLEQAAANSGMRASTNPALDVIDNAIVKKAGQNSPVVDDLQGLKNQLTVNRLTGKSIPTDQSATGILNLKRGVNDTIGRWQPEQQKGVKGVARQVYGALDNELDRTTPEAPDLNQRISSLIPVANRADAADLNANMLQRSLGRFARPTGALAGAIAGGFYGYHHGGIGSALQDATLGIAVPEFIASPTTQMVGARALNSLGGPIARYSSGAAAQLFRGKQNQ